MARDNHRKVKLLRLIELLRQHTDEQNPMTTSQVGAAMDAMGIPCDRRIIKRDVDSLNELGYEVMVTTVGHENAYYVSDRSFSVPELKILIDAVHASSFITEKKSEELIEKIAALAGSHRAEVLKRNMVCFNTRKHSNEKILYSVDTLEEAILTQKKVIFLYYDLDENGERVYRRGGHHYVVEPIALVFNEDNYYLTCYSSRHDSTSNYRIDRMDKVELINERITPNPKLNAEKNKRKQFSMFSGDPKTVVFEADGNMIELLLDEFGKGIKIRPLENGRLRCTVDVQQSPMFINWCCSFGKRLTVISPPSTIQMIKEHLTQTLEQYE
jgi:predicted DNA-binding transcriptional regulator YafY